MKNIRIINIIKEHWQEFKETNGSKLPSEIREDIYESVEKALYCGDKSKGYAQYICMNCGNTHSIGFTCKSKACLKCGRKYALDWADKQVSKMLNIPHSHITFTIPSELRNYFYKNRNLLKEMQKLVYQSIKYYYETRVGKEYTPGVIAVLHTFGDDLKWNPHVHTLVTQGGISKKDKWFKDIEHIPYAYLRKSWQKLIVELLKDKMDISGMSGLYTKYPNGFYVNVEKSVNNIRHKVKYLGRYLGRYPISETRIIKYDGKVVTYTYKEKTTKKKHVVAVPVLKFIGKLVQHINAKHFKTIKRYGLYSRRINKLSIEIIELFDFVKQMDITELIDTVRIKNKCYRERLMEMFSFDIRKCRNCNVEMELYRIWSIKVGVIYELKVGIDLLKIRLSKT